MPYTSVKGISLAVRLHPLLNLIWNSFFLQWWIWNPHLRCEVVHLLVIVALSGVYPIPEILFSIRSANNTFLHLHIEKVPDIEKGKC